MKNTVELVLGTKDGRRVRIDATIVCCDYENEFVYFISQNRLARISGFCSIDPNGKIRVSQVSIYADILADFVQTQNKINKR